MTAGQQVLAGSGGGHVVNGAAFDNTLVTGVGVNTPLTSTFSSAGAFSSVSAPGDWFTPNLAGIGSLYWVRFHRTSGNVFTSGTEDVWLSLAAGQTVGWVATTQGRSWNGTVEFSTDSGGAVIVATDTLGMLIDRI